MNVDTSELKAALRTRALELGCVAFGVTEAGPVRDHERFQSWLRRGWHGDMAYLRRDAATRTDPRRLLPEARSVICVALPHGPPASLAATAQRDNGAQLAALFKGRDYHVVTRCVLVALVSEAQRLLLAPAKWLAAVDTRPLLERSLAMNAGLGSVGRNTQLILPGHGSLVCLGLLVTSLPMPPDPPSTFDPCHGCDACLAACPTGALHHEQGLEAPRCLSYHTTASHGPIPEPLRPLVGPRLYGCDICQSACPWNHPPGGHEPTQMTSHPDLGGDGLVPRETMEGWLRLSGRQLRRELALTAMGHLPASALRRSICVVLGNLADPRSRSVLEATAADKRNAMVAEHAAWALDRLGPA